MGNMTWHVYEGVANGEHYIMAIVGPVEPGETRPDNEPWESPQITTVAGEPVILNHRAALDHEPSEAEQLELVPDEYREKYAAWLDREGEEGPDDERDEDFELDEEERVALGLALAGRIEQLAAVRDRTIVTKGGFRMVEACDGQISALTRIYNRLGLTSRLWHF